MKHPLCLLVLVVLSASCLPRLSRELIRNHPRVKVTAIEPRILEKSAPFPPPWTRQLGGRSGELIPFSGFAVSEDLESAKAAALRDILASVSSYVAVEVESEFESTESEAQRGGQIESSVDARSTVRTRSNAELSEVKPAAFYWEKVATSPLQPDRVEFQLQLLAQVPRAEITRARLKKQLARKEVSGRQTVAVLPFVPVLGGPDLSPLALAFAEELSRRLGDRPALAVTDPGIIQALLLLGGAAGEAEVVTTIRDAMLPDWIIGGAYQLYDGRLRVTYSIYRGGDGVVHKTGSLERPKEQLFALEEQLIQVIGAAVDGTTGAMKPPAPRAQGAIEAYYAAQEQQRAGQNEQAITLLARALSTDPGFAPAHLRLGRILERLGRYGRVPPAPATQAPSAYFRDPCTEWSQISLLPRDAFLESTSAAPLASSAPPPNHWPNVDHVLSAAEWVLSGGAPPALDLPVVSETAAGAYWHALRLAQAAGDLRGRDEALIALADLAARVDRFNPARALHASALASATSRGDLHHQSLAHFGLGRTWVVLGHYDAAEEELMEALRRRALLGEKPYLLEIENELGGLMVQKSDLSRAFNHYQRAQRIAADLGDPYFEAVLGNNLGVLLFLRGETAAAERRFVRAWDRLKDLGEREGMLSSALNIGLSSVGRADLERARAYLAEAQRLAQQTGQSGRRAQLHDGRGAEALARGDSLAALRELLRAFALHDRAARGPDSLRVRGNVAVADFLRWAHAQNAADLSCLKATFFDLLTVGYGDTQAPVVGRLALDSGARWRPWPTAALLPSDRGASYWFALLNAATVEGIEP